MMTDIKSKKNPLYSIGTAARILGLTVHTLRKYEREGLLLPYKKLSKHRLYSESDIERLRCIRSAIIEQKFSIPAIKTIYALIPCWEIVKCTAEDRNNCDAFNQHFEPCWTFKHKENLCEDRNCRDCQVYNDYSTCEHIKNGIKQITSVK